MALLDPPIGDPTGAHKSNGVFEAGGGIMAFVALVGFATCMINGDPRASAPPRANAAAELSAPDSSELVAEAKIAPWPTWDDEDMTTASIPEALAPVETPEPFAEAKIPAWPTWDDEDMTTASVPKAVAPEETPDPFAEAKIAPWPTWDDEMTTASIPEAVAPVDTPAPFAEAKIPAWPTWDDEMTTASTPEAVAPVDTPEPLAEAKIPAWPTWDDEMTTASIPEALAPEETPEPFAEAKIPAWPTWDDEDMTTASIPRPDAAKPIVPALADADLPPANFEFSTVGGKVRVSGAVADKATRAALLDALRAVHGAGAVTGAIAVDDRRASAAWLANMPAALKNLKASGLTVAFGGGDLVIRGYIGDADRARLTSTVEYLFGGAVKVTSLAAHLDSVSARANARAEASLAAMQPDFSAADLVGALNLSVLNFTSSSADVPENNRALLGAAADLFKRLPKGTLIEIAGHTDSTGNEAENAPLSRRRAEAVRAALVKAGVNPAMFVVRGYGGARPFVGNDSIEGRFRNRRIEYRLASK